MPTMQSIIGELTHKRTRNSKHYLLSDGSYQAVIWMSDVHYEDENGHLQNIDTTLIDEADFDEYEFPVTKWKKDSFHARKQIIRGLKQKGNLSRDALDFHGLRVPYAATLPRQFKRGYSIGKGENRLVFKPVGASPAVGWIDPTKPNAVQYQDVWNDVDVELELTDRGVKETLTLKSSMAPTSFSFLVEGDLADDLTAGELLLENAWLEDAAGVRRDVQQTVRRQDGKVYVDLSVDTTGLTFPVVVDPTTVIQPDGTAGKDTYINSASPNTNYGALVGFDVGTSSTNINEKYRSLLQFDLSSVPAGSTITSAVLTLVLSGYASTTPYNVTAHKATSSWSESTVTWETQPSYDASPITTVAVGGDPSYDFELKDVVQTWVDGSLNYGIMLIGDESITGTLKRFESSDNGTASDRPKLTVTYSQTPTAPTVTAPNGGETWNALHTITWNAATDPEESQASLQYHIQLTTDGGTNWHDIVALTTAGATSYDYDFSSEPETSTAKVRIRAYDGYGYGPWDESDGVFTIQHNQAPTAPTNLSPSGGESVDRNSVVRLSWQHNDPNSSDPQSKFDLQWRQVGAGTWNTVTQVTPNQYWDAPAGTFPRDDIEWQVRTYDQAGLSGPYSAQATFFAGDKPSSPTIISPTDGGTVGVARPTVQWSSADQVAYQVQVLDLADTVLWDSGEVNSTNKAITIGYDLANSTQYKLQVRIKNADGLWSAWDTITVTVSYLPPVKPILSVSGDDANGRVTVTIDNATYTNLLGTDGNCEDTSKGSISNASVSLDPDNKLFGNNAIKITSIFAGTGVVGWKLNRELLGSIDPDKHYLAIGYAKVGTANYAYLRVDIVGGTNKSSNTTTDTTKYVPVYVKISPADLVSATSVKVFCLMQAEQNETAYFDGIAVYEIDQATYDKIGVDPEYTGDKLAEKFPYQDPDYPAVTTNDLYRRKSGEANWARIKTGISNSGSYDDYAVASGVTYEYKVRAHGDNSTYTDSTPSGGSITLTGVWLHDVDDPAGTIHRYPYDVDGRAVDWKAEAAFMQFAGRSKPVVEFGESEEGKYTAQLRLKTGDSDYQKLDALVRRKGTVCWRDGRGRRAFGAITAFPVRDETFGYAVTVELTEIAHDEEV